MAKAKFFIRASKNSPQANIRVRFYHGNKFDLTALIGKQINPEYWNNPQGKVRQRAEFKEAETLQNSLDDLKSHLIKEYNNCPDKDSISKEWLNTAIDKFNNPEKHLQNGTLFGFIQHFIDNADKRINPNTGRPVSYKMRREYQVTFNYLKAYAKKYKEPDFIDIDLEFYEQFIDFLRHHRLEGNDKLINRGLHTNTIGKKIQTLKIFLNTATERGINPYHKYKSRNFKALEEQTDNFALTKDELNKFYDFDFSENTRLEKVRDLFIVGCWTGLRFGDLKRLSMNNIDGEFIKIRQSKTGKNVIIPVHYTVHTILKKYDGKLPHISNQKYNEYLREAAKKAGLDNIFVKTVTENGMAIEKKFKKYQLLSSHTARRTFCTIAYNDKIPTYTIMAISGHKTEAAFLKYIKVDAAEHAKKMLETWKQSGEFMRVAN